MTPVHKAIVAKLRKGPAWARGFQNVKPAVEQLVQAGLVERFTPEGGTGPNMLRLKERRSS